MFERWFIRWKRRHFVLTDDLLEYWDRVQDYALGKCSSCNNLRSLKLLFTYFSLGPPSALF